MVDVKEIETMIRCKDPRHKLWLGVCLVLGADFQSLAATFSTVSEANKTLDKPTEACQG